MDFKMVDDELVDIDLKSFVDEDGIDDDSGSESERFERRSPFGFCKAVELIQRQRRDDGNEEEEEIAAKHGQPEDEWNSNKRNENARHEILIFRHINNRLIMNEYKKR
jgi:hypothetical protein